MSAASVDRAEEFDFDVLVVGSGFGGSVAALRLTEKGYRVGVIEAGPRFADDDFATSSYDMSRYLWAPALGWYGIQRIDALHDTLILAGAGVGGGSLVYANTLYEPLQQFYDDPQWASITDWKSELAPFYDQAKRMLGVVQNPVHTPADVVMKKVATDMGVGDTFRPTPVGVFFGGSEAQQGEAAADPYFGGEGPVRNACLNCGECMTGCRHNAKNTLVKNYLYLAEKRGAKVLPLTTVTRIAPRDGGGYEVDVKFTKAKRRSAGSRRTLTAEHVVMAAAALGTQKLLHRMKDEGHLPALSDRLGHLSRTNSESILGAIAPKGHDADYTQGVAITSSWHPDEHTHIEPCRYGKGFNAMALMQTVLTDGGADEPRWRTWAKEMWREKGSILELYDLKHWSERTVIALVMQSLDNSITTYGKRSRLLGWRMTSRQGHGAPNPTWIPVANEAVRRIAGVFDGTPGGNMGEPFNMPLTAHFIGGCTIGTTVQNGVVDPYQRVFGHPGLHVADGSAISANLGVNPSLTITAQAERAMALWPNKGESDPRPPLGAEYERVRPVSPRDPAVPGSAPGALRLPIVAVS